MTTLAERAIAVAETYVGTPFHHQGRAPRIGLDCAGVWVCAYRAVGREIADAFGYTPDPDPAILLPKLERNGFRPADRAQRGDLAVFNLVRNGPTHIAGMISPHRFLHVLSSPTRTTEVEYHELTRFWLDRLHGFYRLEGA